MVQVTDIQMWIIKNFLNIRWSKMKQDYFKKSGACTISGKMLKTRFNTMAEMQNERYLMEFDAVMKNDIDKEFKIKLYKTICCMVES